MLLSPLTVYLEASVAGELVLRTHNEGSSIRTFFGKLVSVAVEDAPPGGGKDKCCLKVDTKKLVACLQWQQTSLIPNVSRALMCFIENEMLVLYVTLNPENLGFLTYYLPVHFLSEDEMLEG